MKIKKKGLVDKSAISNLIKNSDLNVKLAALATKAELKAEQDKIKKFQAFDSSCFCGKITLKMITCNMIQCFSQSTNIPQRLPIVIIFQCENQKDCLLKILNLLLHPIIVLLQNYVILTLHYE